MGEAHRAADLGGVRADGGVGPVKPSTAARLGIKVAAVFKAKSRVQQMLQDEVARLEGE